MLAIPYSKFQANSARWYLQSKEQHQDHIQKFRNYCPTHVDFYPRPRNAGRKPGYPTWERHEDPAVIFGRIEEDKETHQAGSSIMSQTKDVEQGLRFRDTCQVPEKAFKLYLRKELSTLIKKCQGTCGRVIRSDDDGIKVFQNKQVDS